MIYDTLDKIDKYANIPNLPDILRFIRNNDGLKLSEGDIEIKGKDLYVKVLRYFPKPARENKFETHRVYADVQVILEGIEKMQVTAPNNLKKVTEYQAEGDFQFFSAENDISDIVIKEKEFMVFFPGDAHKPGCFYKELTEPVLKLVFKTREK
jgi:YhcH/YjgK/YiaL family protein